VHTGRTGHARHAGLRLAAVVLIALACAPSAAFASRLGSDTVGGVALSSHQITPTVAPDLAIKSGLLLAADGRSLWGRAPESTRPMASITKVMTCLLALEHGDLDATVTISKAAAGVEDATGLVAGEKRTVRELLELALVTSSNDAAYALGEHAGGTMPQFVAMMNAKAVSLGLTQTHYANPHGLDAPGHHSSAADIASLSRIAMRQPEFRRMVALRSATLPAYGTRAARTIKSTNELLGVYRGLEGIKTGYTQDAGHSLVASAQRNGITLTAVILGAGTNAARFSQCAKLLDWGFAHYSACAIGTDTATGATVPIAANHARQVAVRYAETTSVPVFDLAGPVTQKTTLPASVKLPVFAGQKLGELVVRQGQTVLARIPAVAAASVASAEETVGSVPVADYLDRAVTARAAATSATVAPFDPDLAVDRRVDLDAKVSAPIAAGQRVGEIVYSQGGKEIVRVPVVSVTAVAEPKLATKVGVWFARGWRMLTGQPTMAPRVVLAS